MAFHFLTAAGAVLCGIFSPSRLNEYYFVQFILFPISSLIVTLDLTEATQRSFVGRSLIPFGIAWTVLQAADFVNMAFLSDPFFGPAFIAMVTIAVASIRYKVLLRLESEGQRAISDLEKATELSQLSAQIAHDIRSPLALLKVVTCDQTIPEDTRQMLSAASDRIRGVANAFLDRSRGVSTLAEPGVFDLRMLLSTMQIEKQGQWKRTNISFRLGQKRRRYLSRVNSAEFLRVVSNLIDNAVEAVDGNGKVQVTLDANESKISLSVKDNGRGIPAAILPHLFQRGATFGKAKGNGLGLFHARAAVEEWGGEIRITSEPGEGTEVSIFLPSAES